MRRRAQPRRRAWLWRRPRRVGAATAFATLRCDANAQPCAPRAPSPAALLASPIWRWIRPGADARRRRARAPRGPRAPGA